MAAINTTGIKLPAEPAHARFTPHLCRSLYDVRGQHSGIAAHPWPQ
nr:hypothetical protein [Yersinia rohdei]